MGERILLESLSLQHEPAGPGASARGFHVLHRKSTTRTQRKRGIPRMTWRVGIKRIRARLLVPDTGGHLRFEAPLMPVVDRHSRLGRT